MADGNAGDEWCSFGEFSSSEFNLKTENTFLNEGEQEVEEGNNGKWNIDFDNVFAVGTCDDDEYEGASWSCANKESIVSQDPVLLDQHSLEKEINIVTDKCFCEDTLKVPSEEKECGLNEIYIKSKLYSSLQSTDLDPVKSEDTYFYKLKIDTIVSLLHSTQVVENWMSELNQVNTRLYEDDFDFHGTVAGDKKIGIQSKHIVANGVAIKETILTDNSICIDKKVESTLKKVNTHSKSILPQLEHDLKKTSEDLADKSLEEVKNIIYELQIQANIYSELLLNELDYRDKLKRDIEGQNNFISSYVAVERKINDSLQNKKKKSRYTFFKQNDEGSKPTVSIPYIQRDGGPKPADLTLMTEILKAVESDDQGVSKLISDYVINLGDQHNLQTVIQVRTRNGVTSLSAPEHKTKDFTDTNNV